MGAAPFADDVAMLLGMLPAIRLRQCELAVLLRMLSYPMGRVESREMLAMGDTARPPLPYARSAINKAVASLLARGFVQNPSGWRVRAHALQLDKAALLRCLQAALQVEHDGQHDRALRA